MPMMTTNLYALEAESVSPCSIDINASLPGVAQTPYWFRPPSGGGVSMSPALRAREPEARHAHIET
jgi:hypothetical protein